ncbi:MAG: phosphate acyltransferase PlsX [Chloroflexia bacterium]|jgi:glycerol-3-phosphate acyltransferase PlsX|nr:phosphate acyltransferase PlsX [Chloroflexia bacterium]
MTIRIAVDAMGGDYGPAVIVDGAVAGARAQGAKVLLVGNVAEIRTALSGVDTAGVDVEVVEAADVITMDDHPAQAVRRKPQSSINVALRLIAEGRADAVVSAGNSGAVMAASLLVLGRVKGIDRPAIASYIPTIKGKTLLLDLGAVTDPKPSNLVQFAEMGQVYVERILNVRNPTIGLLSNGEEPTKGNALVQQVHPLLAAENDLNFVGNVEGKDVVMGTVDIVVTDGFTGNVALKTAEGVATFLMELMREEITSTIPRKLAAYVLRPAFRSMRSKLDYAEIGGAPLLGVNGAVIIAHGRSSARAIESALLVGVRAAQFDLAGGIAERIATNSANSSDTLAKTTIA